MIRTFDFTEEQVAALMDLLDWAHNEAITKIHLYRNAAKKTETDTQACIDEEMFWTDRSNYIRKLKDSHPLLDIDA